MNLSRPRGAAGLTAVAALTVALLVPVGATTTARADDQPGSTSPSAGPSTGPSEAPTSAPGPGPSPGPTEVPTQAPTAGPGDTPTEQPTDKPTDEPTDKPTETGEPTKKPTPKPPPVPAGRIVGRAVDVTGAGIAGATVTLFTPDWGWVRQVKARGSGRFTFKRVLPGSYIVQVSDGRPAWDSSRRAPSDARVTVRAHRDSVRTLTLRRGGFVTGKVKRGGWGEAARRALIRATDEVGRTFEVRANVEGHFALGGLPRGKYRLWGYDASRSWVGPTVRVNVNGAGHAGDVTIRLNGRTGGVNGFVFEGPELARRTTWVTAINRRTGQWWISRARGGDLSFRGLTPGRYTFVVTGTSRYQGRTVKPRMRVVAGRTRHLTIRLTRPVGK